MKNGKKINQSLSIFRLFARQYGYWPTDVEVQIEHDWIIDNYLDLFPKIAPALIFEKDPVVKEEKQNQLFNEHLPTLLNKLNKYFKSPGRFLFGDSLMLADFIIGRIYTDYFVNPKCPCRERFTELLSRHPEFEAYGKSFSVEMASYLSKRPSHAF